MNMAPFSYYMLLPRGKCSQLDPENDQFSLWKLVFQPRQLAGSMLIYWRVTMELLLSNNIKHVENG